MGHGEGVARSRIEARSKGALIVYATGATGKRAASLRGMKVIIPVDGMSDSPYIERYNAWHLAIAPLVSRNVTLTRLDLIKF